MLFKCNLCGYSEEDELEEKWSSERAEADMEAEEEMDDEEKEMLHEVGGLYKLNPVDTHIARKRLVW